MEMGAPKTIKATVGRAESSTVTVYCVLERAADTAA